MKAPYLRICGVMSGSSLDGLDLAICKFESNDGIEISWEIEKSATIPIPNKIKSILRKCYTSSSAFIYDAEQQFSEYCRDAIKSFLDDGQVVDYIGFHGHTIFHEPQKGYTVQIGNPHCLAQSLNIDVVADFRRKDIALGGQGAPLAPIVEKYLFPSLDAFLNLGGIVNLSEISNGNILAYDLTACNQALNHLAFQKGYEYDDQGKIAAAGSIDTNLLKQLNQLEYLTQEAPKSLSNTWVQEQFIPILDRSDISIEDKMSTTVDHITSEIFRALGDNSSPIKMMISGGGVHNIFMVNELKGKIEKKKVTIIKPNNQIAEFKEALLMGLMAFLRVNEIPNCISSVTGASRDSCTGTIYLSAI